MEISKLVDLIEHFAPIELQEGWDCSGFQVDLGAKEIKKVLLCLSVTQNIIEQAVEGDFDLIIAHHPLFFVPFAFNRGIPIYSAHTNLDKTKGGTTDTLIQILELDVEKIETIDEFLRLVDLSKELSLLDFVSLLKKKLNLETIRVINNFNKQTVQKIAFCAGSGTDFLDEVEKIKADAFVTGDVKYHTALESSVIITDVGHFESEYPVLKTIKLLLEPMEIEVRIADEKSPFINY